MQFLLPADPRRTALVISGQLLIALMALIEPGRIGGPFTLSVGHGKLLARRIELIGDLAVARGCGFHRLGGRRLDIRRNDPVRERT
ncbi:hypothetical protein [Mycolicibacterium houstonense]|uniref:hypothetical protein n=1 Tax=Mycolicibacterium houstonense TaxID=146021 RepID=UPI001358D6FE|nr:hypothetical protein [Mycolicibacterium houstonense]